jgi:hypothetical protein
MKLKLNSLLLVASAVLASPAANAEFFGNSGGGTNFPQGAVSFADAVVAFNPVVQNGEPIAANLQPLSALGVPNHRTGDLCVANVPCSAVSLGDGGTITLQFVDNRLTGSGDNKADLWVFEVGTDIEDTFVEISKNGVQWFAVGKVFGSTAGVDIDAFGWNTTDLFAFVRLRDDPLLDAQVGASVGADIDAVGAISTVAIPEPGTWALMLAGLLAVSRAARRRHLS